MPKKPIDYSKTKIYKIACKDVSIKDEYVGSTTDMVKRRACHKCSCNNEKDKEHTNLPVYVFIRAHGGWDNWDMTVIENFPCKTSEEQRTRERFWLETLGAKLNAHSPIQTQEELKLYTQNFQKKDSHKAYIAKYREEHRDATNDRNKTYHVEHRQEILARKQKRVTCECGAEICYGDTSKHNKSAKHIKAMKLK